MTQFTSFLKNDEILSIFERTRDIFFPSAKITAEIPTILAKPAKRIEHTLLRVDATTDMINQLCDTAVQYAFRGVCCLPRHVERCKKRLGASGLRVISVVDFPLCGGTAKDVAYLAQRVIHDGADEVDMVLDVASLREQNWNEVYHRILMVSTLSPQTPVKVILETGCLTEEEIVIACAISQAAGASFVKTSTGFGPRGATVRDIEVMKAAVRDSLRIKASGGIKTAEFATQLIAAGADVIGTSAGPACVWG